MPKRYGVTNGSTHGFAWETDDRQAAEACAAAIGGHVIDREDRCPNCDSKRWVRGVCGDCGYDASEDLI
jgi:ribosomal protein S27AE